MTTAQIAKGEVILKARDLVARMNKKSDEASRRSQERYNSAIEYLREPRFPRFWKLSLEKAKSRYPFDSRDCSELEIVLANQRRAVGLLRLAEAAQGWVYLTVEDAAFLGF